MAENIPKSRTDDDGLSKRPSIVMIQDSPKRSDGDSNRPISRSGSSQILNPAVKNRTGRPSTEKGKLADSNYSTSADIDNKPTSPCVSPVDRNRRPTVQKRSSAQLSSKTSARSTNENDFRDQIRRKMSLENASSKGTPSTVARQREIQRKTRKEKPEVQARYEDSSHNSAFRGRNDQDGELLPRGEGRAASRSTSRASVSENKSEKFTLISSKRKSKSTLPRAPTRDRQSRSKSGSQETFGRSLSEIMTSSVKLAGDSNNQDYTRYQHQNSTDGYAVKKASDSDNSLFGFSAMSLTTLDYLDFEEHDSNKSRYFPKILHNNELSPLNFTENFKFSYFQMPGHVAEHNKKVSEGWFKLPKLPLMNKSSKRERRKSNLLKRIEKLDKAQMT